MWLKISVYVFSAFLILGSIFAILGFDKIFRNKPWPTDVSDNIFIILLALFFIFLIRQKN